MKKNLAKRVVLGLLTGAVLMSSSVAWADNYVAAGGTVLSEYDGSLAVGKATVQANNSIAIGCGGENNSTVAYGVDNIVIGRNAQSGTGGPNVSYSGSIALGADAKSNAANSVALGGSTSVSGENSVALGYGSIASGENVVSVGSGVEDQEYGYRKIVNVDDGIIGAGSHEAVTGGQLHSVKTSIEDTIGTVNYHNVNSAINDGTNTLTGAISELNVVVTNNKNRIGIVDFQGTNYLTEENNLTDAAKALDIKVKANADAIANVYTRTEAENKFLTEEQANGLYVQIQKDANDNNKTTTSIGDFVVKNTGSSSTVTINAGADQQVIFDEEGITVGKNSTRMDGKGFYVWADGQNNNTTSNHDPDKAIASINDKGEIKAANGAFKVDADGNVTGGKYNGVDIVELANSVASNDAVAGINQRLDKTNAKINKVGAGAAALAALHPLDYDPDDKLTFSAGMGNYAGENAAALGAFYRPNEKFMLSLGGTMGNGENMVNLGISIGLDKANGFAKMSKRELIQEVNAVKAENEAIKADNEAMKAEMAEMKAMLQELLAKK